MEKSRWRLMAGGWKIFILSVQMEMFDIEREKNYGFYQQNNMLFWKRLRCKDVYKHISRAFIHKRRDVAWFA